MSRRPRFDQEAARRDYLAGTMDIGRDFWRYDRDRVAFARWEAHKRILRRKLEQWLTNRLG